MDTIVAAATKYKGTVYALPAPARHHNVMWMILELMPEPIFMGPETQGFITSKGVFVGRRRAAHIAVKSGQIEKPQISNHLLSEDVW